MRIPIDTIPNEGVNVEIDLGVGWAVQAADHALESAPTRLSGQLTVSRVAEVIRVRGGVDVVGLRDCERCNEPVDLSLSTSDIDLSYLPSDPAGSTGEVRLGAADLDLGWYDDGGIDLSQVLSEIIALELPSLVSCADQTACDERVARLLQSAAPGAQASPFAALRDLF